MNDQAAFDRYAGDYDTALAEALSVSGEDKSYYAKGRVIWLRNSLRALGESPKRALDFGCGTGSTTPLLCEELELTRAVGVDVSPRSIALAREKNASQQCCFYRLEEHFPDGSMDLAYCNGVFHHIPPPQRQAAASYVHRSLRPRGLFSVWENHPWNPGTRYIMAQCVFDKDAIPLNPFQTRRLLRAAGFEILRTDFLFVFPRFLRILRPLEKLLFKLPVGAQYQVLCRKL